MEYWEIQALLQTVGVILVILIPVTGLTLRFGLKPFLKDLAEIRAAKQGVHIAPGDDQAQRLAQIEGQLESLESSVRRLTEVVQFDRQLRSGSSERDRSDGEIL